MVLLQWDTLDFWEQTPSEITSGGCIGTYVSSTGMHHSQQHNDGTFVFAAKWMVSLVHGYAPLATSQRCFPERCGRKQLDTHPGLSVLQIQTALTVRTRCGSGYCREGAFVATGVIMLAFRLIGEAAGHLPRVPGLNLSNYGHLWFTASMDGWSANGYRL